MTAYINQVSRWRVFMGFLWSVAPGSLVAFGVLLLIVGLLPTVIIIVTGALINSVPSAVNYGLSSPEGESMLVVLVLLISCLAVLGLAGNALTYVCRVLDTVFAPAVRERVASTMLCTPQLTPLEDPAIAGELQSIQAAERHGALARTTGALSVIVLMRLRGIAALVLIGSYRWWASVILAIAWYLTNVVSQRATDNFVGVNGNNAKLRRAAYLRSLVMDTPAAKEVRVFELGSWLIGQYADAWTDAMHVLWRSRRSNRWLTAATVIVLAVAHAAVLGALGFSAGRGELEGAALLVFVHAVLATSDLGIVGDSQWLFSQSMGVIDRVARLTALVPSVPSRARRISSKGPASKDIAVSVDGVVFRYPGRRDPILDGLTFNIQARQSVAIVGKNGVGKSTLVKLLSGLYEPEQGRIVLNGEVSPLEARDRIGVVFQDFVHYPLTLRENVGFGHLRLLHDESALASALRDAGGSDLLTTLPNGWDTVLSREFEHGADLSGGQWQRVALARAFLAVRGGASLLILDEPTSNLDVRIETEVFERFLVPTRGVTTILVSHRLASVRHADRIVVIDGGKVAEEGTHDELMHLGRQYAEMFSLQAKRFTNDPNKSVEDAEDLTRERAAGA